MPRVIIVGGGLSGLATAYRVQQLAAQHQITILEQNSRPGGTIWTERHDGFQVEIGPNGFLDNKPTTLGLCRRLGLDQQLITASESSSKKRFLYLDGRLRALPTGLFSFLGSDLLSWRGKLSLIWERFRNHPAPKQDESIDAFARRRAGVEVAEIFADALVTGIHAGDPKLLSIRATFPRIATLEQQFGSVLKGLAITAKEKRKEAAAQGTAYRRGSKMWSFQAGLRVLVESLRDGLKSPPQLGVVVRSVQCRINEESGRHSWCVKSDGKDSWNADALVLACPAYQQASVLGDFDDELSQEIGTIAYNRIAVVALGFRCDEVASPPDGFGYIAPQRTRRDVLGAQWCSSIFPGRAPPGMFLLRAMCGGWNRADVAGWDDERLVSAVRRELQLAMAIEAAPCFVHITRWDRAIPQYHLGHQERVARIEQLARRHAGLFLTGNAFHGVAMNDCTEQSDIVAHRVVNYLQN